MKFSEIQTGYPILARRLNLVLINNNNKKRTGHPVDFAVPADCTIKVKENEKIDRFLELVKELKNLWKMKAMVTPIEVCVLGKQSPRAWKGNWEIEDQRRN